MDSLRKQLNALMSTNNNGYVKEFNCKYYNQDVYRLYLVGLCPDDLFQLIVSIFYFVLHYIFWKQLIHQYIQPLTLF